MQLQQIGQVHSCYLDKFGTPRQPGLVENSVAFVEIFETFQPEFSLQGLEEFSHVWLLFHFHKNNQNNFHAKVHPPRLSGKSVGVFATRSPHRPNPLGLSVVKLEELVLSGPRKGLWVRGIDLVQDTPIFDLKPYLPEIESLESATSGWTQTLQVTKVQCLWSGEALESLSKTLNSHENLDEIKTLVEATLELDPRPKVYKGFEGENSGSPYRETHACRILRWDFHFRFYSAEIVIVESVNSLPEPPELFKFSQWTQSERSLEI